MSAEILGGRLLAEVQEEGLDDLLSDLRRNLDPQTEVPLGLASLDRLLEIFRAPRPLPASSGTRWTSPTIDQGDSAGSVRHTTPARRSTAIPLVNNRTKPPVIQLSSHSSAAGKTSLCYLLTTLAILPLSYNGKGSSTIWIDTDGRFSAIRLDAVLNNLLSTISAKLTSDERAAICHEALRHVHLFRPQSASQLVSTLNSLPGYLLGPSRSITHLSASRIMGLMILDSADAFYWQDRFETEVARFEAIGTDENSSIRTPLWPSRSLEVTKELRKLQKLFDCTIVFTSTPHVKSSTVSSSIATATLTNDGRPLPQETPRVSPLAAFATLSLSISREQVRQFAAQMSHDECQRDQGDRLAALAKGRSVVAVDWSASDSFTAGVRDAVSRLDGWGSFAMRVTPNGVMLDH